MILTVAAVTLVSLLSADDSAPADSVCAFTAPLVLDLSAYDGVRIEGLAFDIDGAVHAEALRRHLRLQPGELFNSKTWSNDIQQLMNRGIFATVITRAAAGEAGVCLVLSVRTNWSLLPYLGAQTGAVPIAMIGANYANVLGELVEVGGYYLRRGPYNLGRAWLVLPNVVTYGSLLDIEMVMTGELMLDYPSPLGMGDGIESNYSNVNSYRFTVPERGREALRRGLFVDYGQQVIDDWMLLSARYVLLFETSYELPNVRQAIDANNRQLQAPTLQRTNVEHTRLSALSLTAVLGRIDLVDNFRYLGHETRLVLTRASPALGSQRRFFWLYASTNHHVNVAGDLDLGVRVAAAHTDAPDRRDELSLGSYTLEPYVYNQRNPGVMTIRGFGESSFHGQNVYFCNLEPRYLLFHHLPVPYVGGVSVTLAGYADGGAAFDRGAEAWASLAYATGGGVLISLKNFRYTFINWYYAHTWKPYPHDVYSIFLSRAFF